MNLTPGRKARIVLYTILSLCAGATIALTPGCDEDPTTIDEQVETAGDGVPTGDTTPDWP